MANRILHCGKFLENYHLCLKYQVVGFTTRGASLGDTIYLAVNHNKKTVCGMRAVLGDATDHKPWPDADRYVIAYSLESIQYCQPFDIRFLAEYGGPYWPLKFLQGAKEIKDEAALSRLESLFEESLLENPYFFESESKHPDPNTQDLEEVEADIDDCQITEETLPDALLAVPEARISIMGTFQTVRFKNETDELRGLEVLVNNNFYSLFPRYTSAQTLLIPENRLFLSSGTEARGDKPLKGIRSIPDGLLIIFSKNDVHPFRVALIEYECFGEGKVRSQEKSNYLNGQVIPQLMRFASAFSIVTDKQIRDQTIYNWIDKIIQYIYSNADHIQKISQWISEINPHLSPQLIGREIDRALTEAFQNALQIILVIDDLTDEQKDTITNVIRAFRLENGESIQFIPYVVRLEQRITLTDGNAEYALSVQ